MLIFDKKSSQLIKFGGPRVDPRLNLSRCYNVICINYFISYFFSFASLAWFQALQPAFLMRPSHDPPHAAAMEEDPAYLFLIKCIRLLLDGHVELQHA